MTFRIASKAATVAARVQRHLVRPACQGAQVRFHHPDPFDPKATKGWKAAVKVRDGYYIYTCLVIVSLQ
jgi:hypothetical protein